MDGMKLLGDLLHGAIASKTGVRVVQQAHPQNHPLRRGQVRAQPVPAGVRVGGGRAVRPQPSLGGVLGAAARQHALRQGAHRKIGVGNGWQVNNGYAARRRGLDPGRCDDPFAGYGRRAADQRAALLVRAMIAAAKADGRIDAREEARVIDQLGGRLSRAERAFVQQELARPVDPCALARDTPRGLEDEVYTVSLIAIDLDTNAEARYLHELASELRLAPQHCNTLHQRYGERCLF